MRRVYERPVCMRVNEVQERWREMWVKGGFRKQGKEELYLEEEKKVDYERDWGRDWQYSGEREEGEEWEAWLQRGGGGICNGFYK